MGFANEKDHPEVAPSQFELVAPPVAAVAFFTAALATGVWLRAGRVTSDLPEQENPTQLRSAVVFASFIVVFVCLPVFFLGGVAGSFFRPLALAYILAVLVSLLVALTVTPALSLMLLPGYVAEGKSYLTIAVGCTGGRHRSVAIADEIARQAAVGLAQAREEATRLEREIGELA